MRRRGPPGRPRGIPLHTGPSAASFGSVNIAICVTQLPPPPPPCTCRPEKNIRHTMMAARRRGAAPRRGGARRPRRWPKVLSTACQGEGAQRARRAAPLEPRLERRRSMKILRSSVRVEDRRAGGRGKQRLLSAEADPAGWREGSGDVCGGTARENREETRLEGWCVACFRWTLSVEIDAADSFTVPNSGQAPTD